MITFIICILCLVSGYFLYGRFVERFFGADPSREVPASVLEDGAAYGPASYIWTAAAFFIKKGKQHWMCSLPAAFLTFVCVSYFMMAPHVNGGLHLSPVFGYSAGIAVAVLLLVFFALKGAGTGRLR